jgi:putative lipoprotein
MEPTPEPTPEATPEPVATEVPAESVGPASSEEPSASASPAVVEGPAVSGTFELPEDAELPDGATWSVELQDTSLADAPAVVIGEDSGDIEDTSVTEVEFAIAYDPDQIVDTNTYSLQVRVEDETGDLLFVNDTAVTVLTDDGETTEVSIPVVAAEALPEATAGPATESPAT